MFILLILMYVIVILIIVKHTYNHTIFMFNTCTSLSFMYFVFLKLYPQLMKLGGVTGVIGRLVDLVLQFMFKLLPLFFSHFK